jgi:WD40 repeat protein
MGHTSQINIVDWSADNEFLASGDDKGGIKIWDNLKTNVTNLIDGPVDTVRDANFNAECKKVIIASNKVQIFDYLTGIELKKPDINDLFV